MLKQVGLSLILSLVTIPMVAVAQNNQSNPHVIYGALGFTEGGLAVGGDYEYTGHKDFGVGGYFRLYQKDDSGISKEGISTIGGFLRTHLYRKPWDFYLSPGFGIVAINSNSRSLDDTTSLGPSLSIGLLYELNKNVEIGVENMRTWVWLDSTWHGLRVDDLLFKVRINL
ncbi:MAG: hypothetical protein K1X29_06320 [Bdellovibrionales bacterium]|nr:hypothetical protein [Bdellovibrionales bacterium]